MARFAASVRRDPKIAVLTLACVALCCAFALPLGAQEEELNLDGLQRRDGGLPSWKTYDDAQDRGASISKGDEAPNEGRHVYRWDYELKRTASNEYPYCGLSLENLPLSDFSGWDGVLLTIKASREDLPLVFEIGVVDSKLGAWKPLGYRLCVSKGYATYKLPFSKFRTLYWWLNDHPGGSGKRDLDQVAGLAFQPDSPSGDKASVYIAEMSLYKGQGRGPVAGEIAGPVEEELDLRAAPSLSAEASIRVEPSRPFEAPFTGNKGRVNPMIWGSNWGQWMGGFPDLELSRGLNLKLIRVGGNDMSRYNWRNSLYTDSGSSKAKSQPSLEEFVAFCRAQGAEPLIQVNAFGWAPSDKSGHPMEKCMTERDAADLVTYLNKTKGLGVKYFEIDNEFELWGTTHADLWKSGPPKAKDYLDLFIKYAVAMKKAQGTISRPEDIKIVGPANCAGWTGWKTMAWDDRYGRFDTFPPYFLDACAGYEKATGLRILDVYSFHYYASYRPDYRDAWRFIPEGPAAMLESTQLWWNPAYKNRYDACLPKGARSQIIPTYRKWIADLYPGTELAITEFNLDAQSKISYSPALREVWQADVYGIMGKYGIDYAMEFALNSDDVPMTLIGPNDISPSYWIYKLYADSFNGTVVEAESDKPETLNVYACVQDSGDLVVMVINKDAKKDWTARLGFADARIPAFARTFPRLSLTRIKIEPEGGQAEIATYGLEQIESGPRPQP